VKARVHLTHEDDGLSVAWRGVSVPLLWTALDKKGLSSADERIALMARFLALFPVERIEYPRNYRPRRTRRALAVAATYVVWILVAAVTLVPIYWMVVVSARRRLHAVTASSSANAMSSTIMSGRVGPWTSWVMRTASPITFVSWSACSSEVATTRARASSGDATNTLNVTAVPRLSPLIATVNHRQGLGNPVKP
jgi:hypothetical protein